LNIRNILTKRRMRGLAAIAITLAVSGIFKGAAFARESFIAARFGLSAVTDAYFALQQFPITLATYVYGALALAFVPAYVRGVREGSTSWLPGLVLWALGCGATLTALMLLSGSVILRTLHLGSGGDVRSTLVLLSYCFAPILMTGIWAAICTARGQNLWAMSMSGFPYLFMTIALVALYAANRLNNRSLPLSMSIGFILVGIYSMSRIIGSHKFSNISLCIWRDPSFKTFLRQLGASSGENLGYAGNQLLIIYFLSQSGTGAISSNSCAMRIAMLAFTLLGMPLGQLVQAKLCTATPENIRIAFKSWLLIVVLLMVSCAGLLVTLRVPLIRLVYMHGKFQANALPTVAALLPAWAAYVTVMSVNAILARYLFILSKGTAYLRNQLTAYVAGNLLRVMVAGRWEPHWIIWCSVLAEGCSMLVNLRLCLAEKKGFFLERAVEAEVA
jgi:putative peptidoglycan lipid II flippase